jgi:serine/threonine-protein kinase HipA
MEEAQALVEAVLDVVRGWREFFMQQGVEPRSIDVLAQAMLPPSFFGDMPPDTV